MKRCDMKKDLLFQEGGIWCNGRVSLRKGYTIRLVITDELDPTAENPKDYEYSVSRIVHECLESHGRKKVTQGVLDKIKENFKAWVEANPSQEFSWDEANTGQRYPYDAELPESLLNDLFDFSMLNVHSMALILRHTTEGATESDTQDTQDANQYV